MRTPEQRRTKKDYIEAAYQRIQDARYMGMGETAIRVELSTMWDMGEAEAAQGAAPREADHKIGGWPDEPNDLAEWSEGAAPEPHRDYAGRTCTTGLLHDHSEGAAPRAEGHAVRYVDAGRDEPPENGSWRCSCGKSFAPDGVDEYASHLAAPRAEGLVEQLRQAINKTDVFSYDTNHDAYSLAEEIARHLAAPRAEGLDVERLAEAMWESLSDQGHLAIFADSPEEVIEYAEAVLARLSRPSDERVPESEER